MESSSNFYDTVTHAGRIPFLVIACVVESVHQHEDPIIPIVCGLSGVERHGVLVRNIFSHGCC
jgi:hypothetical protein